MSAKKKDEHSEPNPAPEKEPPVQPETEAAAQSEAETPEQEAAPTPAPTAEKPPEDSERYLRLMAEFDNYKKRSAKERENI